MTGQVIVSLKVLPEFLPHVQYKAHGTKISLYFFYYQPNPRLLNMPPYPTDIIRSVADGCIAPL